MPFIISGAKYSGVPQKELVELLSSIFSFDNPKSVILIYPSLSISTFSGFKLKFLNFLLSVYNI